MPPWYKTLISSSSSKKDKTRSSSRRDTPDPPDDRSRLPPDSSSSYSKPRSIPPQSSRSTHSANSAASAAIGPASLEDDDDDSTAPNEHPHTAVYGSSPSHARPRSRSDKDHHHRKESRGSYGSSASPPDDLASPPRSLAPLPDPPPPSTILSNPYTQDHHSSSHPRSQLAAPPSSAANINSSNNIPASSNISSSRTFDVDDMIARLLDVGYSGKIPKSVCLKNAEIQAVCYAARDVFMNQPALIELSPPVKIIGDVHGQYSDLIRLFEMCSFPPAANYLFLGDYVDRGKQSLETILLLLCYKIKYPENFFLLRGNHECANVTRVYGFYDECKRRCNIKVWKTFIDVFNCLPIAAIVASKIFCVHGGLSPNLSSMDDIRRISRPTDVPDYGLLNDLLWSDPSTTALDWEENERGVSYCFGKAVVQDFLARYDFDLICRAHMVVMDGYEFWNDRTLVTIFSAPNYCGEFENFGGVMSVSEDLLCAFELLKPLDGPALRKELAKSRRRNGATPLITSETPNQQQSQPI